MSEFINTIDALGDDAVIDSIIDRTIAEFKDNKLTDIGKYAFYKCAALTNVDIPNVTRINGNAFEGCTSLVSLNAPSVTNQGLTWEQYQFKGCTALESANLPALLAAKSYMFDGCSSLTNIVLPKATSVEAVAFQNCKNLKIADFLSLSSFAWNTFQGSSVTAVLLRNTARIATLSHAMMTGVTGYFYVPKTMADGSDGVAAYQSATNWSAFADKFRALEDYTLDGTVDGTFVDENTTHIYDTSLTSIQDSAFESHPALKDVTFTNVTSVGSYAFYNNTALESVNLPNATTLEAYAFKDCSALREIHAPNVTTFLDWDGHYFQNCTALKTTDFPLTTKIPRGIFSGCTSLESVNFPMAKSTDVNSFYNCVSLTELNLPEVTNFSGIGCLDGCTSLSKISVPKAETVGVGFRNCTMTVLDLPSVKAINYAILFYNWSIQHLLLRNTSQVCTLSNLLDGGHQNTADHIKTVMIYVPRTLLDSYKSATNWSTYAEQFRALEDYTVDGTVTGELDESKI